MSIYKECDIRGVYPEELDEAKAYDIGRAIGTMMHGKTLSVGGDVRLSTPSLKKSLINGLRDSGTNIIDIGTVPTPVFYYSLKQLDVDGGVTVTASHNPARYNGFKLMFGDMPVTPDTIKTIKTIINDRNFSSGKGSYICTNVEQSYTDYITGMCSPGKLKVVLDCCNGTSSRLAPLVFSRLGYDVVPLYCTFDGSFPNRDPNPAIYSNLRDLSKKVPETGADFGAAFDGDGDRVVFVDDEGHVLNSESSFVIFVRHYLGSDAGTHPAGPESVVYDIKSSSIVKDAVLELGGRPIPERSGHAFIKKTFLENRSVLAGEISGHFFFRELGFDDGLYAALKMAEIISRSSKKLSQIFRDIPKTVITPDIRVHCKYEDQDKWLDKVKKAAEGYDVSFLDGIRINFDYGWILIRKSVTEEGITIRIEAKDDSHMSLIKAWLADVLPEAGAYLS